MRPVKKWSHTDVTIDPPIHEFYNPYQSAKDDLERNIDSYCSYCERPVQDEAAHVEHILPKSLPKYEHLTFSWSNFLLGCSRCNGADNKGDKDLILEMIHLPHRNNTSISIFYDEGGAVRVNDTLVGRDLDNAKALIELVGLDKRPGRPGHLPKDKRWDRRREVWEIAKHNLSKYEHNLIEEHVILDLARAYGFWSVWYSLFHNHINVKKLLITAFRGTASDCFDANFNPIFRNPRAPLDRV